MDDLRSLLTQAIACQTTGQWTQAQAIYQQILQTDPHQPDALHLSGLLAHQRGDHESARRLISAAIAVSGQSAAFHNNLGAVLQALGRWNEALASYQQAVRLRPDYVQAIGNVGNVLLILNRPDEAQHCFARMIQLCPDSPDVLRNLAVAQQRQGRHEQAIETFRRALAHKPDSADCWTNLAGSYVALRRSEEAIDCCRKALSIQANHADAYVTLGRALHDLGRLGESSAAFDQAVELAPANAQAQYNRGILHLLQGDFAEGWNGYEARFRAPEVIEDRADIPQPRWTGEPLAGKSILVYCEQGFGDAIQFARYVPLLKQLGARVILQCLRPLERLMRRLPGVDQLLAGEQGAVQSDFKVAMLSLPCVFRTDLSNIPPAGAWVKVTDEDRVKWQARMPSAPGRLRVGIAWAGNRAHHNDHNRSIPLQALSPLLEVPGVQFVSLQKDRRDDRLARSDWIDFTGEWTDFADTAATIDLLDCVISVDTSIVHLAGTMGKPTWLLLPAVPDWRWLLERSDSPWYPSVKLFRQNRLGDWSSAIARVAQELAERVEKQSRPK